VGVEIRILRSGDTQVLARVEPGVFDNAVDGNLTAEFLNDPRHHLAVAIDEGVVTAFASAVHYVHPDKPPQLWINEVGVAPTHRKQGLGKAVVRALLELGRSLGCSETWVLTERNNTAAMALYTSLGGVQSPEDTVMFAFRLDS
jgi:ribosomal protein S18 acetylase RimI-like enzyme